MKDKMFLGNIEIVITSHVSSHEVNAVISCHVYGSLTGECKHCFGMSTCHCLHEVPVVA